LSAISDSTKRTSELFMKITTIAERELDPRLEARWLALQRADPALESAYFHPAFTRCVAAAKPGVEIAVMEDAGEAVGFFPFERTGASLGEPVGAFMSDYHGLVTAAGTSVDARELLRACRLDAFDFSHLPLERLPHGVRAEQVVASPFLDLADGYEAYVAQRRAAGSEVIGQTNRRERRLVREIGAVRFEAHESDPAVLETVLAWKSAQYLRTTGDDIFRLGWTRDLLAAVHATQADGFAGTLSTLYAGDRLIAGHFGMRSRSSWHYWFPAYDPEFSKYSPGLILILKMAESAPRMGARIVDLGTGALLYKDRLATGSVALAAGAMELSPWRTLRRRVKRDLVGLVRNTRLEAPARAALRAWRSRSAPEP
jgi:CelD/BcsL family acetyltransferase involved in cellulose biosynthesis